MMHALKFVALIAAALIIASPSRADEKINPNISGSGAFSGTKSENVHESCRNIFGSNEAAKAECIRMLPARQDCCLQYMTETKIKEICAGFSTIRLALDCITEIHSLRFWKEDLVGENRPGLGSEMADRWKANAMRVCIEEKSISAALNCAVLQKSGIRQAFQNENTKFEHGQQMNDPILHRCMAEWKDDYAMIEYCVKRQRASKERLGL